MLSKIGKYIAIVGWGAVAVFVIWLMLRPLFQVSTVARNRPMPSRADLTRPMPPMVPIGLGTGATVMSLAGGDADVTSSPLADGRPRSMWKWNPLCHVEAIGVPPTKATLMIPMDPMGDVTGTPLRCLVRFLDAASPGAAASNELGARLVEAIDNDRPVTWVSGPRLVTITPMRSLSMMLVSVEVETQQAVAR